MKKRSQVGMEYIVLGGFVFFAMIVAVTLLQSYASSSFDQMAQSQLNNICWQIVNSAESMYYMGTPSKQTLEITMPADVRNLTLVASTDPSCTKCYELVFHTVSEGHQVEIICSTNVMLNATFTKRTYSQGIKNFVVQARSNQVFINMTR
ncbi:MAG: hypothetical protein ABH879_03320 [archaeon]